MGVDTTETITSFVKCLRKSKTEKVSILVCKNKHCTYFNAECSSANFCAHCGHKIGNSTKEIKVEAVDPTDVLEKDNLYWVDIDGKYDYYLPNKSDKNEPQKISSIDAKRADSIVIEIPDNLPLLHKKWFMEKFSKDIEILEKAYGKNNVSVHYGLIHDVC